MAASPINAVALFALKVYKAIVSPVFYLFGARCRHEPTCSAYAAEAFRKHKAGRAFWLTLSRVSRCHPWGSHGYDPVPDAAPDVGWRFWRLGDWALTERGGETREP
ncbi:MAG: membrane protein insertion efficiency factor YidD [Pseudomonadota bacterium]